MPSQRAPGSALNSRFKSVLFGNACLLVLGVALALTSSPAAARYRAKSRHFGKKAERVDRQPFGDIPSGPLQIFISIDRQRLQLYSDGVHIADAPVATGVPGHLTPMGVFNVIQRDRFHHSNIYSNAPMPFMQRITWSGVALHEGPGVGHEASHGCIRMPADFAARLWRLRTMGMGVIIARAELQPAAFSDPRLFVHKDAPPPHVAARREPVETAQRIPLGTSTDAVTVPLPATGAQPHSNTAAKPATTAGSTAPAAPAKAAAPLAPAAAAIAPPGKQPAPVTAKSAAAVPTGPSPDAVPPVAAAEAAKAAVPDNIEAPISLDDVPMPPVRPAEIVRGTSGPIAIFVSRKLGRIYVRQDFTPLFSAPIKIADSNEPLGTHVFTALNYLPDHAAFRWDVVSLPADTMKVVERWKYKRDARGRIRRQQVKERIFIPSETPAETPQQALARIQIPPDVAEQISELIVPGSSLVISDQGLGTETGRGTDFIVITH